jgi:Tol biopolymer transport system component
MRLAVVSACVVALAATPAAAGSFPGRNGAIAFVSDRLGANNLYLVEPDGSAVQELTHSFAPVADLQVSSDRRRVVFTRIEQFESTEVWVSTIGGLDPRRLVVGRELTSNSEPTWSPDGRRVAFIRFDHRDEQPASAFVIDVEGGRAQQISRGRELSEPSWSPDGERIAFTDESTFTAEELPCGIVIMRPDGSGFRELRIRGSRCEIDPAWSPDGRRIAFWGDRGLGIVRADSTQLRWVARFRRNTVLADPEWSPDGAHIAFSAANAERGEGGIYVASTGRPGMRRITRGFADASPSWTSNDTLLFARKYDLWRASVRAEKAVRIADFRPATDPAWSPDRESIVFSGAGNRGGSDLFELAAPGGRWRTLVASGRDETTPAPSPDGRRLAFTRSGRSVWTAERNGQGARRLAYGQDPAWSPDGREIAHTVLAVWVVSSDGKRLRRLTPVVAAPPRGDGDWSPDGRRIAFTRPSADYTSFHVYVVNRDGTGRRALIRNASDPAWSPDGRSIAFVRDGDIWTFRLRDRREQRIVSSPFVEHSPAWGRAGVKLSAR